MQNRTGITALALCAALALPAFGADEHQWSNVQALERGTKIGVVQMNQKRIEGAFESASETGITLQGVTIEKNDVVRVYKRKMSRTKRTLIGAAIGAAGGAIVAGTIASKSNDEGFFGGDFAGIAGTVSTIGGAGIGASIGALSGSGYKTVYRRP